MFKIDYLLYIYIFDIEIVVKYCWIFFFVVRGRRNLYLWIESVEWINY